MRSVRFCLAGIVLTLLASRAGAQAYHYPLQEMNFDMWCQEDKGLPPERCDKRLPQDDSEFQAYRSTIEKYELPYLQRRAGDQVLSRVILHNDQLDDPTLPSAPQVDQPARENDTDTEAHGTGTEFLNRVILQNDQSDTATSPPPASRPPGGNDSGTGAQQ